MSDTARFKPPAVVIYSGGMDSYTLIYRVRKTYTVHALSFDYGQKHGHQELQCAQQVCQEHNISWECINLHDVGLLFRTSALTNKAIHIPEGHYTEENMKATVVPNRNMILLSIAAGYALSIKARVVFYGAHYGDHTLYPDCRPQFVDAINHVMTLCDWHTVRVETPYLHLNKIKILQEGLAMGLDYSKTWSCYNGGQHACGKCGACNERLAAFQACHVSDPLTYL